jgi:hypothetical protein
VTVADDEGGRSRPAPWRRSSISCEGLAIRYLAIASTAIAFVLWDRAWARLGPERTGLFAGPMPVSAALAGAAVTTGPQRPGTLMGTIVTGTGVAVGLGSGRSREGTVR